MKILITGSFGFIGFHTSKHFLLNGHQVLGIDNLDSYYDLNLKKSRKNILEKFTNFSFVCCDINEIEKQIDSKFDLAINLAAQPGVRLPKSDNYKYEHSNINGFINFLHYCEAKKINKIIYASSSSVYSGNKLIPYSEEVKLSKPKSFYAHSKIINEIAAEEFSQRLDVNIAGLRFFTVYGPYGRPDMAYFDFTKKIYMGESITLFNNGRSSRDMTYIDDVVRGIDFCSKHLKKSKIPHEVFNIGNENPIQTSYLVKKIENEFMKKAKINFIKNNSEVNKTCADISKAKNLLNFYPQTNFNDGIKHFFDWFKSFNKL